MDCRAAEFFLADEKFDFDVSLSPASASSDEDEVFVGPIRHKEKCVSTRVASGLPNGGTDDCGSWSPLTGDQLDAVCQEAHKLATQLQSSQPQDEDASPLTAETEEFVQDVEAKNDVLVRRMLSPIKRETFSVKDSPMKQLPPAIQRQLQKRSFSATRTTTSAPSARRSTSSPVAGSKAPARMVLRGKPAVAAVGVLPNKPSVPTGSCSASNRRDTARLQPPSRAAPTWKRSPSSRISHRAESSEELLSDSASVASDISDSSLNNSLLGKRSLAPPSKQTVGVRNLSTVKAPPLSNRRNTSSSSSSVSSFNSSLSLSPAKGKRNSSLNRSVIGPGGPTPSSISKPTNRSSARRSTARPSAELPATSMTSRRSVSAHSKKHSEALPAKVAKTTPQRHTEATPCSRLLERSSSVRSSAPGRPQSSLKAKSKPEATVEPTPSTGSKSAADKGPYGVSSVLRPKRLMSLCSLESLPQKPSPGSLTPSASLRQLRPQRPSALPTPVKRRASAIPSPLSTNLPKMVRQPPVLEPETIHGSSRKQIHCRPASIKVPDEEAADVPDIKPFCLEEVTVEPTTSPPSHAQEPNQSEGLTVVTGCQKDPEPETNLQEPPTTEESGAKGQEVLLLDLPPPALQPQEKLLIDLTNTPDLIRTTAKSCMGTQLIDLSSPLIKWSPEEKRENNAPLINLSF